MTETESKRTTLESVKDVTEKAFADLLAVFENKDEGWKPVKVKHGVQLNSKSTEESAIHRFNGRCIVECSDIDWLFKAVAGIVYMKELDPSTVTCTILHSFDEDHDIIYIRYTAGVPLVSDRDFVYLENRKQLDDGTKLLVGYSVEDPDDKHTSDCVRGVVHVSGYAMRPGKEPGTIEVLYQLQIDPKGWLPIWLVNMLFLDNSIQVFDNMRNLIKKHKKEGKEEN